MSDLFYDVVLNSSSIKKSVKRAMNNGYKKDEKDGGSRLYKILSDIIRVIDKKGLFDSSVTTFEMQYKLVYDLYKGYDKEAPKCKICGVKTVVWNPKKLKYKPICDDPKCIETAREMYSNNMISVHGTDNLAATHEGQVNMQSGRDIAKEYIWSDGTTKTCLGMVEYHVLEILDKKLKMPSDEVKCPCPFYIKYQLPEEHEYRNYLPDIYLPNLNLIISCKDGMENPNRSPHFRKDRYKSLCQYMSILNNTNYNFVQIEGDEGVKDLEKIINKVKEMNGNSRYVVPPRIDFVLYGESDFNMDLENVKFNCITDSSNEVVFSYFSSQTGYTGFTIINDDVVYIDVSNFVDKSIHRLVSFNTSFKYDDLLNLMNYKYTKRNDSIMSIQENFSLFDYIINGSTSNLILEKCKPVSVLNLVDISMNSKIKIDDIKILEMNDLDSFVNKKIVVDMDKFKANDIEINTPIYIIAECNDKKEILDINFIIMDKIIRFNTVHDMVSIENYNKDFANRIKESKNKISCFIKYSHEDVVSMLYTLASISQECDISSVFITHSLEHHVGFESIISCILTKLSSDLMYNDKFYFVMKILFNVKNIFDLVEITNTLVALINNKEYTSEELKEIKINDGYSDVFKNKINTLRERISRFQKIANTFTVISPYKKRVFSDMVKMAYTIPEERSSILRFLLSEPQQ